MTDKVISSDNTKKAGVGWTLYHCAEMVGASHPSWIDVYGTSMIASRAEEWLFFCIKNKICVMLNLFILSKYAFVENKMKSIY